MTLALPLRGDRARYDITVVSHENTPSGKEPKKFSRRGYSRVKSIGTKVGAALVALMIGSLMLLGSISTAPAAKAGDWGMMNGLRDVICGTAYFNINPEDRGLGPDTADPKLMDLNKTKITAYEKYGMAGLSWTVWLGPEKPDQLKGDGDVAGKQLVGMGGGKDSLNNWAQVDANQYSSFYNTKSECNPVGDVGPTSVGNFLLSVTSWIINISNLLFQTATETSSSVLATLSPTVVTIVTQLKDALYLEFLAPVIMIGALYMGWKGLVKRSSTEAGTSAVWMFGAVVAGLSIMANPMFLSSVVDGVVSKVSETTISAITNVALAGNKTSGVASSNASLCSVDAGNNGKNQTVDSSGKKVQVAFTASQDAARTSIRQIQCTMWYSFMYTPWVIGQFGVSPSETDNPLLTKGYPDKTGDITPLEGTTVSRNIALGSGSTPGNWAIYQLDNKVNYPGSSKSEQQKALLNVAASQLLVKDTPNGTWKGTSAMNRITTATLAMISSLGAGAMIAIISMSIIVLQIGLIILTLLAPLFLLIGVHPGFGRRIALGWLESMAGLAMKRIVLSVLLSIMLVFYSAVLSVSASTDWLISMIMVIAVSVGGITYKDKLTSMFSKISLGGNGGLSEEDMGVGHVSRAGRALLGGAVGTAAAFGAGALKGGGKALAHNKELQQKAREEIAARRKSGDDPAAGAGPRPNKEGPDIDDESPVDSSGAGERPQAVEGSGEIDGQGELFPEADVRPKQAEVPDPRLAGDIAAGQDRVNDQRRRLSERAGINGHRPASEGDGRRAMLAAAHEEALRENARYNRFKKINAVKEKFDNKIDAAKGKVERTVGLVGDGKAKAVNAVTRSVAKSAPVRAVSAARDASRARIERAREAANSYHALAKSNSQTYNRAVQRHNEKKVVKQERRAENREIRQIVANNSERRSVANEAMRRGVKGAGSEMRHAMARAKARNNKLEIAKMVNRIKDS